MNKNYIKTTCGIEKYNELSKNKSLFGFFRLKWFVFFATFRDIFK